MVVDLDGTLIKSDTLVESVVRCVKSAPLNLLRLPLWLLQGRAGFKRLVAENCTLSAAALPYRAPLIEWLREEKIRGRQIVLATAAHTSIAQQVSAHLDLFDKVIATDGDLNLSGENKLRAIRREVGHDFTYAGDSQADMPIWCEARTVVMADVSSEVRRALQRRGATVEREFTSEPASVAVWLKALRLHQWVKNLLLFVPLLTSFSFQDLARLQAVALAFIAFSLAASATYVTNDIWDLDSDRAHPRKRHRPFASAALGIPHGLAVALILLVGGLLLGSFVSLAFLAMLTGYVLLTTIYSWALKEYILLDVLMLAMLYTLRIVAGSAAAGIPSSSWLLAFSAFLFLSLALIKRCAELVTLQSSGKTATRGRDYRVSDLVVLWPMGVSAGLSAVVVFGLFISTPETASRYSTPEFLWLVALGLVYWQGRLWIKTARGEMNDDPIVFALRDRGSLQTILSMVLCVLAAHSWR